MIFLFLAGLLLVAGAIAWRFWKRRQAVAELLSSSLSDAKREIVIAQVPLIRKLPQALRQTLEGKIHRFLDQVDFVGCNGLHVDEEMKLSIAAQACLLIVNSDLWYERLSTVLIYPGAFKSVQKRLDGYVVTEEEIIRSGESWQNGPVILSWEHAHHGALDDRDGHNVVLHEFAHQIDSLSGATNGVPLLATGQSFAAWERAFLTAYEAHVDNVRGGRRTAIDAYGAQNHQEFFAVAVELFFERPKDLKRDAEAIYLQLSTLFRLDPLHWT